MPRATPLRRNSKPHQNATGRQYSRGRKFSCSPASPCSILTLPHHRHRELRPQLHRIIFSPDAALVPRLLTSIEEKSLDSLTDDDAATVTIINSSSVDNAGLLVLKFTGLELGGNLPFVARLYSLNWETGTLAVAARC